VVEPYQHSTVSPSTTTNLVGTDLVEARAMLRLVSIMMLVHVVTAAAGTVDDDAADAPVPARAVATVPGADDPFALGHWRADGGLGFASGDVDAFVIRGHLGASLWWMGARELVDGTGWHAALRVSGGAALGVDVRSTRQYYTAAPFAELGFAMVKARDGDDAAKQVTFFARVEPRLLGGELEAPGARVGVGVTLHGVGAIGLGVGCDDRSQQEESECELGKMLLYPFALPVLAAINVRDVEFATDVAADGRREYAMLFGFGV
jgi:hypothetical protein